MITIYVAPGCPGVVVDVSFDQMRSELGWISIAYPFEEEIGMIHDDDGIANGRMPNRTLNGQIIPGPFYLAGVNGKGELSDLSEEWIEKYLKMFAEPEVFPAGHWKVETKSHDEPYGYVLEVISSWVEEAVPENAVEISKEQAKELLNNCLPTKDGEES